MKKDFIRKAYLKRRQELSNSIFKEESSLIIKNTIDFICKHKAKNIHCFLPIHSKNEIDTLPIIQYCWENNISVVVPVSNFENSTLKNAKFKPDTKTKQVMNNITEPIDPIWVNNDMIEMVITPLLAFNHKGYRVGFGGGFYDHFFALLGKNVKKIGISLFGPCGLIEDINENDIPLTHCVTPKKTYTF
jgi:5-formyltetrahydrofolate cyclo-ligase